jgi:hypothetical protein
MSTEEPVVTIDLNHLMALTNESRFLFKLAKLSYVFKPISAYDYHTYKDAQDEKESARQAEFDLAMNSFISCHDEAGEEVKVDMKYFQTLPTGNFTLLFSHLMNASFLRTSGSAQ